MKNLWIKFTDTKFYKNHKEEITVIPILFMAFYLVNLLFSIFSPNSALFDLPSQAETYWSYNVKLFMACITAIFVLWVLFPPVYKRLYYLYHNFDELSELHQNIAALVLIVTLLLCGAQIARGETRNPNEVRIELKKLLDSQLSIRETTSNRGPEVDMFLLSVGVKPPAYWCGAYVAWDLTYLHIKNPNSAWSPSYANPKDIIWRLKDKNSKQPLLGDVFTEYYKSLGRVGHVGFYLDEDRDGYFIIQAGNTSGAGSRNGDRVGRKKLQKEKIYAISRYIL